MASFDGVRGERRSNRRLPRVWALVLDVCGFGFAYWMVGGALLVQSWRGDLIVTYLLALYPVFAGAHLLVSALSVKNKRPLLRNGATVLEFIIAFTLFDLGKGWYDLYMERGVPTPFPPLTRPSQMISGYRTLLNEVLVEGSQDSIVEAYLSGISPKGTYLAANVILQSDMNTLNGHLTIVDIASGRTLAWEKRGILSVTWDPKEKLVLQHEYKLGDKRGIQWLSCSDVNTLKRRWQIDGHVHGMSWSLDGWGLLLAVGERSAKTWKLLLVSRSGKSRLLEQNSTLRPQQAAVFKNIPVILCGGGSAQPTPIALLDSNGVRVGTLPVPLARGRLYANRALDRVVWQAEGDGRCVLALKRDGAWVTRGLTLPAKPKGSSYLRVHGLGDDRLHVEAGDGFRTQKLWQLSWDGNLTELRFPESGAAVAYVTAIPGSSQLLRVHGILADVIDPTSGRVVRSLRLRSPRSVTDANPRKP